MGGWRGAAQSGHTDLCSKDRNSFPMINNPVNNLNGLVKHVMGCDKMG